MEPRPTVFMREPWRMIYLFDLMMSLEFCPLWAWPVQCVTQVLGVVYLLHLVAAVSFVPPAAVSVPSLSSDQSEVHERFNGTNLCLMKSDLRD